MNLAGGDEMTEIQGSHIRYSYDFEDDRALGLSDITIEIQKGAFVAVLGHNGCGKSTLVKHLNALLELQEGTLTVAGMDVGKKENIYGLRRCCGMVFQNPDNQFVSSVVKEDVAFGLENYDTPPEEIPDRVNAALKLVGMEGFGERAPHTLSGGQKQRIALAGVLAMEPDIIVFDEATAMLDGQGRKDILNCMQALHRQGKTIIMITHYVEEAVLAEQVLLMNQGRILAEGPPREILTRPDLLEQARLAPPLPVRMYYDLAERGIRLTACPLTEEELVEELCRLY